MQISQAINAWSVIQTVKLVMHYRLIVRHAI